VAAPQSSVAVTAAGGGGAAHSTVRSAGTPWSAGGMVSRTLTSWEAEAVLPEASTAVHVRRSVWLEGQGPGVSCSWSATVAPPQSAVAVTAGGGGAAHSTVRSAGTPWSAGGTASWRVTSCVHVAETPAPLVAVHVRRSV